MTHYILNGIFYSFVVCLVWGILKDLGWVMDINDRIVFAFVVLSYVVCSISIALIKEITMLKQK